MISCLGTLILITTNVRAEAPSPGNCNEAVSQIQQAKDLKSEEIALSFLAQVSSDIQDLLQKKNEDQMPKAYLARCLDQKSQAFRKAVETATESLKAKIAFKKIIANLAEAQGDAGTAYKNYWEISENDPQDYESRRKAYLMWSLNKAQLFAKRSSKNFSQKDVDDLLVESEKILKPLIESPTAPPNYKISALKDRAKLFEEVFKDESRAHADWKAILLLDPKDAEALTRSAAYFESRHEWPEAETMLQTMLQSQPTNKKLSQHLLEVTVKTDDEKQIEIVAKKILKESPDDVAAKSALIKALMSQSQKEGALEEASKINLSLLKSQPDLGEAKTNEAKIETVLGDRWSKKKINLALEHYNKAFHFDSNNFEVREKMAALLYDYRKSQNFSPSGASKKDMDEAMKFLEPIVATQECELGTLHIAVGAGFKSSNMALAEPACEQFEKRFQSYLNSEIVLECAKIYKSAGKKEKSQKILQSALVNPKFKHSTSEITQALSQSLNGAQ